MHLGVLSFVRGIASRRKDCLFCARISLAKVVIGFFSSCQRGYPCMFTSQLDRLNFHLGHFRSVVCIRSKQVQVCVGIVKFACVLNKLAETSFCKIPYLGRMLATRCSTYFVSAYLLSCSVLLSGITIT